MKSNKEVYEELRKQYTLEEIADFAIVPAELDEATSKKTREEFVALRMKMREERTEQERFLSGLLSLKYQIRSYLKSD